MAESFGTDAERYDRSRPRYPDALVGRIVAESPGPDVLDVGCGTGIVARQLQAAGCRVSGVEPDARMADLARQHGIEIDVATFEAWDPDGRAFDAVVAGQAWHWVDPVAGAAKAAQALRTGGILAVFWNAAELPADLREAFAAVRRELAPELPDLGGMSAVEAYLRMCARAADGVAAAGGFGDSRQWRFDWKQPCTRDQWLDQLPTTGFYTQMAPDKLASVLVRTGAAIDAVGGSFTIDYSTVALVATRT